jgi:hypothetical protein
LNLQNSNCKEIVTNLEEIISNKDSEIVLKDDTIKQQKKEIRKQKFLKFLGLAGSVILPILTLLILL